MCFYYILFSINPKKGLDYYYYYPFPFVEKLLINPGIVPRPPSDYTFEPKSDMDKNDTISIKIGN